MTCLRVKANEPRTVTAPLVIIVCVCVTVCTAVLIWHYSRGGGGLPTSWKKIKKRPKQYAINNDCDVKKNLYNLFTKLYLSDER